MKWNCGLAISCGFETSCVRADPRECNAARATNSETRRKPRSNQAWRKPLEERQHVATLQLAADYYLANGINSVDLEKTGLAMSKPIVVTVCMARSSKSWKP